MERIGELAAFAAAISWTTGALFFERGIKRIGVLSVNFFKVVIGFVLLTITAAIMRGMPLPLDVLPRTLIFLSLSGLIGFVIMDMFLFTAYGTVGPRVAMLFLALSPPITTVIAYLFLGETIGSRGWIGMFLVISGIVTTVFARHGKFSFSGIKKEDRRGYIFALLACLSQPVTMVLIKAGVGDFDPVSATQIRVFVAIIGFGLVSLIHSRGENIKKAVKNTEGLKYTAIGAIFGPYLGVTLTIFAVQRISTGIVSTLIGLTPVLIIAPEILILKKKIKPMEIIGALLAVSGTAVFFLL